MIEKFDVRIKNPILALNEDPTVPLVCMSRQDLQSLVDEARVGILIEESQLSAAEE